MPIRGVIFDFDGTLADTLPLCVEAFRRASAPLVGRELSDEQIMATFGPAEEGSVYRLAPNAPTECLEAYLRHYEDLHAEYPEPFAGIVQLLEGLRKRNVRLALVTGKGPRSAEISMRVLGLGQYFEFVEAGSPDGPRKAEAIRDVLDRWKLHKHEVVYVGDHAKDVTASREVGIGVVGVAWARLSHPDRIAAERPDALFFHVEDLADWLSARIERVEVGWLGQEIVALSQSGSSYTSDKFDCDRYERLRQIGAHLLESTSGYPALILEGPFGEDAGYATPKVDVRAAVFRGDQILLVKERDQGLWSVPGGFADVNSSPAESAVREVREESGLDVRAVRLLGIVDRNRHGYPPHPSHIYKVFFLCEEVGGGLRGSDETSDARFFSRSEMPPLSKDRIMPQHLEWLFECRDSATVYFD
jgi:phosphoglycolate phosphatase-like HAD superfamily hydrolase/ADP-ribose pyrophosphatase YjhB (NUDIX family)